MIEFMDKNGRIVKVETRVKPPYLSGSADADEIVLALLEKLPKEEFLTLPVRDRGR